ncbi:MAG TPA: molybdate ABC transporter substrate-binding protein [Candidatus Dormibacteraeota bacterium]|nr:molybdate ABC transporter substrate-binding protein [Candidatus Dormibacteraeota bacterium]
MIPRLIRFVFLAAPLLLLAPLFSFRLDNSLGSAHGLGKTLARSREPVSLTVSAAISLKDALEEMRIAFVKQHPAVTITFNFGASGMLQQQIENGAPVDIFISAAPKQMDALDAKGLLLAATRRDVVHNQLVLIVPHDSSGITGFADLARTSVVRVALGEPGSVPAGQYAQEVLRYLKLLDIVNGKSVLAKDVRQVLTYVETGNVDAGIVYRSDALQNHGVKIVAEAPASSHAAIRYPAAVLRSSQHSDAAREFLAYLGGQPAGEIFEKRGFLVVVH